MFIPGASHQVTPYSVISALTALPITVLKQKGSGFHG